METLPNDRIEAGLPAALADAARRRLGAAAEAIMTTDTRAEGGVGARCRSAASTVAVTGISKGAGMIRPNMATMLGFVATDAAIAPALVQHAGARGCRRVVQPHHDRRRHLDQRLVRADRDAAAPATRRSTSLESADGRALRDAVFDVVAPLAQAIVRDGEGATKFITVRVDGGASVDECRQVAYAIAHSPLVKTAFFASDPNLGRILAAVGYAGIDDLDQTPDRPVPRRRARRRGGGRRPAIARKTASG